MTISTTTARVDYLGNGVTTEFPVPFAFFGTAELAVIERDAATGAETVLSLGGQYGVAGGDGAAGTVTALAAPAAGKQWTILRATDALQTIDYQANDSFPAESHERALDRLTALLQERDRDADRSLRVAATDALTGLALPSSIARANKVLAFDSTGAPVVLSQLDQSAQTVMATGAGVARSLAAHLRLCSPANWGGAGNGLADDTAALQNSATYAGAQGLLWVVPEGVWRTTSAVVVPGGVAGVLMEGKLLYDGAGGEVALTIGDGGSTRNRAKRLLGLWVVRNAQSDWTSEADIGLRLRNLDACRVEVRAVEQFTIGLQTYGDARGFEDSDIHLGRLTNNKIQLDVHAEAIGSWNNSVRYYGGHLANDVATNPTLDRFGVRFSKGTGGYNLHNAHTFYGTAFELQNQAGLVAAIPFLSEVNSRGVRGYGLRIEGNSPTVARHTAGAQDHVYEIAFSSNGAITGEEGNAYLLEMDYPAGATRAGGTIVALHQAAAAQHSPRLIAGAPSLRATAFRWSATEVGFDGLAVLSANPSGPPTTLTGLAFAGLSGITLNADSITMPTSRALGFVVDCTVCKEFFIAAEGSKIRPTVMLFDAAETVLGNAAVPLASNQGLAWNATAQWWQSTADAQDTTYTRLQRITVPAAAKKAIIGIGSSDPASLLSALRLYTSGVHAPQVLAGGGRAWGTRELRGSYSGWAVPDLASGAVAQLTATTGSQVLVTGARQGDSVAVGYVMSAGSQNGGVVFGGSVSVADRVSVSVHNQSAGTIQLDGGATNTVDLIVTVTKPRV